MIGATTTLQVRPGAGVMPVTQDVSVSGISSGMYLFEQCQLLGIEKENAIPYAPCYY